MLYLIKQDIACMSSIFLDYE